MNLLNLGCGFRFHEDWTNLDFISSHKNVLSHDLLKGIPYPNHTFDVVYHSHLLEHFKKSDGREFIKECYRVLRPGGIIRVAVPDLERIAKCYLVQLEEAVKGATTADINYDWMLLEMYDQTLRNYSGGEIASFLYKKELKNEEFVYSRWGQEAKTIRENHLKSLNDSIQEENLLRKPFLSKLKNRFENVFNYLKFPNFPAGFFSKKELGWIEVGKFRTGGEIHQWMYDRYSLNKLLNECNFENIEIKNAFESNIPEWNKYELDSKQGIIHKPDSLFMEGIKRK